MTARGVRVGAAVAAVPVLLLGLQIFASRNGFEGPLVSTWHDFTGTPKSVTVPWAGLALALVGLTWRWRFITLGLALGVDAVFAGVRLLDGATPTLGSGPTIALTALAMWAVFRWDGVQRRNALHAAALGALLILATKVGDVWLHITVIARPTVLDQYVLLADHALGEPSWVMGRLVDAAGPVVYGVLHWVYIELPVMAMVVAVWQLRHVVTRGQWPSHYLVRTFLVLGLLGPVVYVIFPVVGPMFAFGADGHGLQVGNYWPQIIPPLDTHPAAMAFDNVTPRNCMPSMHTAWALTVFIHSRRDNDGSPAPRLLRWAGAFWLAATLTATLGFGYHYGVDLVAGAVLCMAVESALRAPERGWDRTRIQLVGAGFALLAVLLLSYRYLAVEMAEFPVPAGIVIVGLFAAYVTAFYRTWFARRPAPAPVEESVPA
ncbi:inositol phosphorylceramide synthase [Nocardia huaxiensis]|uniref:Inositol phosphorylceramide synthase n=1 Tax=Nocardia huaxiensis TaxID=2755382 RepID=A0A7D6ZHJ1_9NOCA|nr:phosphatase PAP2 family protein [Nocardia huaxiensis]QLY30687.1 inositol phosphorylceramide synthase [Nocardia huaxiensis]UFS94179.1 phosphatase PAP2 family protein [Nocardia huaxiensis]